MRRTVYGLTALWFAICVTYFLHPQLGIPLWPALQILGKGEVLLLNSVFCGLAIFFYQKPAALLALAISSAVSVAAMHSWIGAHLQVLPWAFLFLALLHGQSSSIVRTTTLEIFVMSLAATLLYCFNPLYLSGAEFGTSGTIYRLLPSVLDRESWMAHRELAALIWMAAGALTVLTLPFWPKVGWSLFLFYSLVSVFFFRVLFFAFFIFVPLFYLWEPEFLLHWRKGIPTRIEIWFRPVHLYALGMVLFFIWYSYFLKVTPYIFGVPLAAVALSRLPRGQALPRWRWSCPQTQRAVCLSLWLIYLVLPALAPAIPAPFGMTQLTARQLLHPFQHQMVWPRNYCRRSKLALRWGYRIIPSPEECLVSVYSSP